VTQSTSVTKRKRERIGLSHLKSSNRPSSVAAAVTAVEAQPQFFTDITVIPFAFMASRTFVKTAVRLASQKVRPVAVLFPTTTTTTITTNKTG
jgi:hypothetical protein